jgi:beta-lactamase regulating signal transducer with metallopeptidase domain
MTPSYFTRLLLLSSASFFIVQLIVTALVAWATPVAIRRASVMRPQRAARLLLGLRLLPTAFALLVVAAQCIPSYLRFEPGFAEEEVGIACLAAAILGAGIGAIAIYRASAALVRSSLYVRRCGGQESRIQGEQVWMIERGEGIALAGIGRPRLLISGKVIAALSSDQLTAALEHERAHQSSKDNLKRLLILLAPAIFPQLRKLEREWIKCAEWSADDRATAGDAGRAVALAEALVRVARMQSGLHTPVLMTSLIERNADLSERVDRLLRAETFPAANLRMEMFAAIVVGGIVLNPASLGIVHQLLEKLLD